MSLTLARLCGEWQLVSKNYKGQSGKQLIQDMNNLLAEQIIQDMSNLLAESRYGKQKGVEEIRKPLKKIFLDFSEIGKPLKKIEF